MKLRTRLILVLLVLSVVPVAAVTTYSYVNNLRALQDTAAHEADLLASELSARMELVTAELSDRVERLMNMPATPAPVPAVAAPTPTLAAPTPQATADAAVAQMLGSAAMLLESVELQGVRGMRGGGGANGAGGGRGQSAAGGLRATGAAGASGVPGAARPSPPTQPAGGATLVPAAPVTSPATPARGAQTTTVPPPPAGQRGQRPPPEPLDTSKSDASHVRIDMAPIVREMAQKINPDVPMNQWTPEMRQQLSRSISERLTGIQEGIRLSVSELEKKADEAKAQADQSAKSADSSAATVTSPTHRTSALAGNSLAVTVEQNGHVQKASAQINLDSLLKAIFSTTRRDQGEVPFAVAKDGKLYTATEGDKTIVEGFGAVISPKAKLGRTILTDWVIVTTADPTGSGLRFGIARPVGDSVARLRKIAGRNAGLGLLLIGLAIVGVVPVSQRLTRNLSALTEGVQQIARGDLGARVLVESPHDEVGTLATAVNKMAEDLESHQRALLGQERLKRELELGRQIQNEMLPHEPLRLGLTEVTGVSVPAREVGGDFFNYFALPTREVALLVGDVSGKGVGAALVMANIQATLRTRLALGQDLPVIADAIDREMDTGQARSVYATLFVGILDPITKRLRYVNAGHHPQFVLRANGELEGMHSTGLPIGLLSGRGYTQGVMQLAAGDFVFFYTDGIVEAEDEVGDFFGTPRLEAALVSAHKSARESATDNVLARVEQTVATFRGTREPLDDATMMAVRIG